MIENAVVLDRAVLEQTRGLVACANLQSVRFSKFAFKIVESIEEGTELDLESRSKVTAEAVENGMAIRFDLRLQGKNEGKVKLDIAAQISARYALPAETHPSPAQMKMFGQANGMLNVWPYWREYVQSATSRAGLPPLTLPLFRIIPKRD